MYTSGGLAQDPNRRDEILRAKRRKNERLAAAILMVVAAVTVSLALITIAYGMIRGQDTAFRVAVGALGGGMFLLFISGIGYFASLNR